MGNEEQEAFDKLAGQFGEVSDEAREAQAKLKLSEELTRVVDKLDQEQYGRAITVRDEEPQTAQVRQTDQGVEVEMGKQVQKENTVAVALPLNRENTRHLVVSKTGDMLVGEPSDPVYSELYISSFSPNETPLHKPFKKWRTARQVVEDFRSGNSDTGMKVTHMNTSPDQAQQFEGFFDTAIQLAQETKAEREKAKTTTMRSFLDKANTLFKRPDLPRHHPPHEGPGDQPPSTPPKG